MSRTRWIVNLSTRIQLDPSRRTIQPTLSRAIRSACLYATRSPDGLASPGLETPIESCASPTRTSSGTGVGEGEGAARPG